MTARIWSENGLRVSNPLDTSRRESTSLAPRGVQSIGQRQESHSSSKKPVTITIYPSNPLDGGPTHWTPLYCSDWSKVTIICPTHWTPLSNPLDTQLAPYKVLKEIFKENGICVSAPRRRIHAPLHHGFFSQITNNKKRRIEMVTR